MNTKQIALYGGGFIGTFLVILALTYMLFPYLNSEAAEKLESETAYNGESFQVVTTGDKAMDALNQQITNLQLTIDSLNIDRDRYVNTIDSLKQLAGEVCTEEQPVNESEVDVPAEENRAEEMEGVSSSLLRMDEEALSPIVNLLDETQLISLYTSASNLQKEKLLRSLSPQKAATILKQVMS